MSPLSWLDMRLFVAVAVDDRGEGDHFSFGGFAYVSQAVARISHDGNKPDAGFGPE